ncbi:Histidinol-phosphate aminotransferase [Candidatus Gugararchaeum adminiculabundum]|nr:Histidinol-phosphate aminotransferase [Candidatus Gugararchaeum adminiculabundum]
MVVVGQNAVALNSRIRAHPTGDLLSRNAETAFFPKDGILAWAGKAADMTINATIGVAKGPDESGKMKELYIPTVMRQLKNLSPEGAVAYSPPKGIADSKDKENEDVTIPGLGTRWKEMQLEKNPTLHGIDTSTPIATLGLTGASYLALKLTCDHGDEIITTSHYWENYGLMADDIGARIKTFKTFVEDGKGKIIGGLNIGGLREMLLAEGDKKTLLLNFPNNPTGYSPTIEEAGKIRDVIFEAAEKGKKITVIIDDAYFGFLFTPDAYGESLFSLLANVHENVLAIKVDGPTKESYVWGFRVGFITIASAGMTKDIYAAWEEKMAGMIRRSYSNGPTPSQKALLAAYGKNADDPTYGQYLAEKKVIDKIIEHRFRAMQMEFELNKNGLYVPVPTVGGYFSCFALVAEQMGNVTAEDLALKLHEEPYSTGIIPMSRTEFRVAFSGVPIESEGENLKGRDMRQLFVNISAACEDIRR